MNPAADAKTAEEFAAEVKRSLFRLAVATVGLYLVVIGGIVFVALDSKNRSDDLRRATANTAAALCSFKHDLEQRVTSTEDFLAKHPNGLPGLGLSAAVLQQDLTAQQQTLLSLAALNCKEIP